MGYKYLSTKKGDRKSPKCAIQLLSFLSAEKLGLNEVNSGVVEAVVGQLGEGAKQFNSKTLNSGAGNKGEKDGLQSGNYGGHDYTNKEQFYLAIRHKKEGVRGPFLSHARHYLFDKKIET